MSTRARTHGSLALLLALVLACGADAAGGDDTPSDVATSDAHADQGAVDTTPVNPVCQDPAAPGPYAAGVDDLLLPDPQRGDDLRVRAHYPATLAGQRTPPDRSHAPWPLVILSHGFLSGAAR